MYSCPFCEGFIAKIKEGRGDHIKSGRRLPRLQHFPRLVQKVNLDQHFPAHKRRHICHQSVSKNTDQCSSEEATRVQNYRLPSRKFSRLKVITKAYTKAGWATLYCTLSSGVVANIVDSVSQLLWCIIIFQI